MVKNNLGQTTVEYILFIAVITVVVITLSKKVKNHLLGEDGECNNPESTSFICEAFNLGLLDRDGGYRYFTLRNK
tara:strand:- start:362 stop:586 length:225 start_codon:yes stop_codon:yes gene_type:complete